MCVVHHVVEWFVNGGGDGRTHEKSVWRLQLVTDYNYLVQGISALVNSVRMLNLNEYQA